MRAKIEVHYRLSSEAIELLGLICHRTGGTATASVEWAVRELARMLGITPGEVKDEDCKEAKDVLGTGNRGETRQGVGSGRAY